MDANSIGYDVFDTELGVLLVAATRRGVCSVRLGDDAAALEASLRADFPKRVVRRDAERLAACGQSLLRSVASGVDPRRMPQDVAGTPFQRRVWRAIRRIPPGSTRAYADLARDLGMPRGARAVARACGANPAALLVPCHRVVGRGGALCGYRWGVGRKRALLERESAAADARGRNRRAA